MRHEDLRSPNEIFDDMLADEATFDEIADRLSWTRGQVRQRYLAVCRQLGVSPDED